MGHDPLRLYVAATRQNEGKTLTSLGLIAALRKRFERIGYMKPVGQRFVEVEGHKVDEDAVMVREACGIDCDIADMSPIAVPPGFTESYIMNPNRSALVRQITEAFERVADGKEVVILEGTGHAGVGSVIDLSNGEVAALLEAPVLLVTQGGVGRPIDEIMLNRATFDANGVHVLGAVVNKVIPDKLEKIDRLTRMGLERKGVEALGVMPFNPVLTSPTLEQLLDEVNGELLSGERGLKNSVTRMLIGAMPPHDLLDYLGTGCLLITPGNREDLILAAMSSCVVGVGKESCVSGMILTCGIKPHDTVLRLIRRTDIPVILVEHDTFQLASNVDRLIVKIRASDTEKLRAAEALVCEYVDVDRVLELMEQAQAVPA
jgi:BioD-like phosphotransacetylase family protein